MCVFFVERGEDAASVVWILEEKIAKRRKMVYIAFMMLLFRKKCFGCQVFAIGYYLLCVALCCYLLFIIYYWKDDDEGARDRTQTTEAHCFS